MERLTDKNFRIGFDDSDKLPSYVAIYERLREYENLEEQGELLKLHCAVGDIVWDNDFGRPCRYEVTGFSFGNLNDGFDEEMELHEVLVHYTDSARCVSGRCPVSEIGKTVFLTKQSAEQAMKGMEGKNG